ncbi:polynucleotide 5'-hydroxyl-kinase NOL9 [Agrilus planipennis]|uniref:Polynucleotide 5'-hydroxyl-kinase NOL9 n=1 Tax=Agrilus planipennis TaxID=224129 RepID=A0A1W4XCT9_AGRPL|nr:polynucleotide 5'-hydroxyl-kinase NOL9 [Agrilus planipennis]
MDKKTTKGIYRDDLRIYPRVSNSTLKNKKNTHEEQLKEDVQSYLSDTFLPTPEMLKCTLPANTNPKRRKTVSFSNDVNTPDSKTLQRECTPYKFKHKKSKLDKKPNNLVLNFCSSDSYIFEKESNCDSIGMTDSSFVSSAVGSSLLLPSLSEFATFENPQRKKLKKKTKKRKLETTSSSDSLSDNSATKNSIQRHNKKIKEHTTKTIGSNQYFGKNTQSNMLVKKLITFEKNDNNHMQPSTYFDVDEVHFEGKVTDPLTEVGNNSQTEDDNIKEILNTDIPKITYEVQNVEMSVGDNNYTIPENFPKQITETYAEFCSTLETSVGNISLEDSVFASDIYTQNETSFSISSAFEEDDVEIEPSFSLSDDSADDNNTSEANLNPPKSNIKDAGETLNGFCSPSPLMEQCNGFINPPEVYENEENPQTAVANFFQLDNSLIIIIKPESKLYFNGYLLVTVLQGAVEVLGYKLTPNSKSAKIYSPRGNGCLYFETVEENNIADLDAHPKLKELHIQNSSLEELLKDCQPNDAMIYCETFENSSLKFMENYVTQPIFPKPDETGLRCVFTDRIDNWKIFEPNEEWECLRNVDVTDKIFICGGKGVGKSSMLRYCINSLLAKFSKILVIDLDPGQPEFTLPGCVSAVIIDEPIFGPNYTQLRKTERSFFVSNIDVSNEPREYLNAVKEIVTYTRTLKPMVTFVNYMGYSRGLGVNLAASVITILCPTILIQIKSKHIQRNFKENLTPEFIENQAKLFLPYFEASLNYQYVSIGSVADGNRNADTSAKQLREMRIFWYFGKIVSPERNLLTDKNVPVYEISLSDIKIIHNKKIVPPLVVNGNLVCLCHKRQEYDSCVCIGWGIVRAVDLVNDKLYLITPVLPEDLELINYIALGSIYLPDSIYLSNSCSSGLMPYVAQGVLNIFGEIPKRIQEYNRRKIFVH